MQADKTTHSGWPRTFARALVMIVIAFAVLAAGVFWHDPLGRWVGLSHADAAPAMSAPAPAVGKQLWTCGMHPQVIKDQPGDCPICHMKLTPLAQDNGGPAATGERKIAYYWDPMIGPESISDKPGKSTMNMDLVPVYKDAVSGGTGVRIDPVVVQNMGVRVATATRGPLTRSIRAVGYLAEAQPLIHDVNLRVSGWIEKLYADVEGQHVEKDAPLLELYSPEVQVAVQELIAAARGAASTAGADDLAAGTTRTLLQSSRAKLAQWGLGEAQIDELSRLDTAPRTVTFRSPVAGDVTMKNVVAGAAVKAGDQAMRIVDRSTLWLDAQVYEQDFPLVRLGRAVSATVDALPGDTFAGKITFIHPLVDPTTRTVRVRIEIANADLRLRPGMYATATIDAALADDAVLVPREAVIDTGTRAVTFVSVGDGRFEPRELKLGAAGSGMVQVLSGVAPGETIVVSGQFLLDAESRMKEAIQRHLDGPLLGKQGSANGKMNVLGTTADLPANEKGMPGMENMNGMTMPEKNPPPAAMRPTAMGDMPGMSNDMPGMTMPATTQAAGGLPWSPDVDGVYRAYLALATLLTAGDRTEPADAQALADAAKRLEGITTGPNAALPKAIHDASAALAGQSLKEQRESFKAVGAAVIAMADARPPSKAAGGGGADKLFVVHCPMVNADWLQTDEAIANPYMPTMPTCGEVKRSIPAVTVTGGPR